MQLRYNYRLRVGAQAERALLQEWDRYRFVWNQALSAKRLGYWLRDTDITFWRNDPDTTWLAEGSVVVQQQALRTFWATKVKKWKSFKRDQPSLQYSARGFSFHGPRLRLAGGIFVNPVWSRELPSKPTSLRIYRDSLGHWYVSFVVEREDQALPATHSAIGIDWGVAEIATTTDDALDLPHPEHGRRNRAKLARYQRQMARRKPQRGQGASKGYKRAKKRAARAYKKVARQRQDTARKWARAVVAKHDHIAVEDFRPKFMAKNRGLARKAQDGAISATKNELVSHAQRVGRKVVLVPPAHTTMDCSNPDCGARAKSRLDLSERTFECHACGLVILRDKNSARVILAAAGFNRAVVEDVRPAKARKKGVRGLSETGIPRL